MIKLTKTPILPSCQEPNGFFCMNLFYMNIIFVIQELKFSKIAQLFCVSVSLVRGNVRELSDFFNRKSDSVTAARQQGYPNKS